jgi:hypothetical protein
MRTGAILSHATVGCAAAACAYVFATAPHAVSRNASATEPLKYLVIQVSDPSKPSIVPEK